MVNILSKNKTLRNVLLYGALIRFLFLVVVNDGCRTEGEGDGYGGGEKRKQELLQRSHSAAILQTLGGV